MASKAYWGAHLRALNSQIVSSRTAMFEGTLLHFGHFVVLLPCLAGGLCSVPYGFFCIGRNPCVRVLGELWAPSPHLLWSWFFG